MWRSGSGFGITRGGPVGLCPRSCRQGWNCRRGIDVSGALAPSGDGFLSLGRGHRNVGFDFCGVVDAGQSEAKQTQEFLAVACDI